MPARWWPCAAELADGPVASVPCGRGAHATCNRLSDQPDDHGPSYLEVNKQGDTACAIPGSIAAIVPG
jgi:hypothetical protein